MVLRFVFNVAICRRKGEHNAESNHEYKRDESRPMWQGWHASRRGLATNLNALGIDPRIIQEILRHANLSTTYACYIKGTSEAVQAAMAKLDDSLTVYQQSMKCSEKEAPASQMVN